MNGWYKSTLTTAIESLVPVLAVDLLELVVRPLNRGVGEEEGGRDVHGPALQVLERLCV